MGKTDAMKEAEVKENGREALKRARSQAVLIRRLRERAYEEGKSGLRAIRFDAQIAGGGTRAGLEAGMIRREETARILRREEALMRRMEKKAREAMAQMKPEQYAFCALYYIAGMSIQETAGAIDRSERQCIRYRREIEGE